MRIRGSSARCAMLGAGLVFLAAGIAVAHKASASGEIRTLSLYEIHTKESLTVTYKRDGKYDEEALKKLNHFMRDWRADESTQMDRELVDLIWTLHRSLGSQKPIHLISGYRSPATNAKLRRSGGGQAKKSQHMEGKAADIHFPDIPAKTLRNSALVQEVGGVGYYPTSGIPFVHVDTGNVRMWPRIPRLELAALFPDGQTKHLPSDGRPITKSDYQLAMAKGLVNKTMVASAVPAPTPKPGPRPASETPQPLLVAYAPGQPVDDAKPVIEPTSKAFVYASAGGFMFPKPRLPETGPAPVPSYESAQVVGAPEVDDDHPDELSYVPFDTANLMMDTSVARSETIAPLTHPEQDNIDYLFDDMDKPTAFQLRRASGYRDLASAQQFSGDAVKSLYAETEQPAPTRLAQSTR
ncbi:MAG: DUF882 domain-containing protein [Methyloceanibacter sp.]|uniref:DUF882 domain-containing protein n=1 Tax=Methyloceanibacter sp. TaxID=1965321 RepID=UPI003D6D6CD5